MSNRELKKETKDGSTCIDDLREDRTRVKGWINNSTGKVHFMTLDANGKMIESVHGYFR